LARLAGKVALITGATRGIGRSVAEEFAREGAHLFLVGYQDQAALAATLLRVRELGASAQGGLFDVGELDAVRRMADQVDRDVGTLDILVNNAGIIRPTPLLEITPEQWDRTIRVHLYGAFYCTREMTSRFLKPAGRGKIINVTAPAALRGSAGVTDYASAKGGIIAFTKNAARELAPFNIQVNAVLPVAHTRMTEALSEYYEAQFEQQAAARLHMLPPSDRVASTFLFFASQDSDYVTGQVLAADGGLN
jgi:3-oxoacyl-[acyl-carrier protein] reductase